MGGGEAYIHILGDQVYKFSVNFLLKTVHLDGFSQTEAPKYPKKRKGIKNAPDVSPHSPGHYPSHIQELQMDDCNSKITFVCFKLVYFKTVFINVII